MEVKIPNHIRAHPSLVASCRGAVLLNLAPKMAHREKGTVAACSFLPISLSIFRESREEPSTDIGHGAAV